jgi:uncharacterized protein YycO
MERGTREFYPATAGHVDAADWQDGGKVLRPGDLIFVRGSGLPDRLIEYVTDSPYSHVSGAVGAEKLVEAQAFMQTKYQNLDFYIGNVDIYTCDILTDEQRRQIMIYATAQVGTPYDYWLILWEAMRFLLNWDCHHVKRKKYICSTLWADAYRAAGVELCPHVKYPVPGDLSRSSLLRKMGSY